MHCILIVLDFFFYICLLHVHVTLRQLYNHLYFYLIRLVIAVYQFAICYVSLLTINFIFLSVTVKQPYIYPTINTHTKPKNTHKYSTHYSYNHQNSYTHIPVSTQCVNLIYPSYKYITSNLLFPIRRHSLCYSKCGMTTGSPVPSAKYSNSYQMAREFLRDHIIYFYHYNYG